MELKSKVRPVSIRDLFEEVHKTKPTAIVKFKVNIDGENQWVNITPATYKKYLIDGIDPTKKPHEVHYDQSYLQTFDTIVDPSDIYGITMHETTSVAKGMCSTDKNKIYTFKDCLYLSLRNKKSKEE